MEGKDWNEEWEKNYFKPIVISDRCVVHSSFHTDIPKAEYDIVIDPKMAFGTGHHSTTNLMVSHLLDMNLEGKSVIDMDDRDCDPCRTCVYEGSATCRGHRNRPWSVENAVDNVRLNSAKAEIIEGDASALLKHRRG